MLTLLTFSICRLVGLGYAIRPDTVLEQNKSSLNRTHTVVASPSLSLLENMPPDIVSHLLDSLASNPGGLVPNTFLWIHYGDSEIRSLGDEEGIASNLEGSNFDLCIHDLMSAAATGADWTDGNRVSHRVWQAIGGFFMKSNPGLSSIFAKFLARTHGIRKFTLYDQFYFPVGTALAKGGWVHAAQAGQRPIILIGPEFFKKLKCMLNPVMHFQVSLPWHGCGEVHRLAPEVIRYSNENFPKQTVLIVIAASAVGKITAYQAFKELWHKDIVIEVGASLDAFAGVADRDYNHDLTRFCRESKPWMEPETCNRICTDIHPGIPCQVCH
eukprot:TRINITY_DN72227_c0_g1_i1.p1 TRINITY_DN72227_c0_g1~~TRINITY_DN72227_c0_g1_i1.p1  ORF type:complete len:327 (+),score=41.38 TRINITY_DN72227_c0_g1_i1:231-1211(+)